MALQILLGPQSPTANLRQAVDSIDAEGPVVVITAGWRDSEGEIEELREDIGRPVEDLMLYQRAEEIFAREPDLLEMKRERQDQLRELQGLYRIRLSPTIAAVRRLMRTRADPKLLLLEQRAAIAQLRALDRHHLRRIMAIHREFDLRRAGIHIPLATAQRDALHRQVEKAGLVLIAGGHVAVLLNRIRLFRLGELLAQKPVIAWSAGAMALSDRIVLFHQKAPQGKSDAEVLDAGLGIVRHRVLLPHARTRLDWNNRRRLALFSRRFAPANCCTLDNGSMIRLQDSRVVSATGSSVLTRTGRSKVLAKQ
jgi:peptidase E